MALRLLGAASVEAEGTGRSEGLAPGVQRLLARVALARGRHVSRSALAFSLWPDSGESQARTNLRKMLHQLRRDESAVLGFVEIEPQRLRLRSEGPGVVDVEAFEAAIEQGDDLAAAAAYGGDLLPECYEDWVLVERSRLRECACQALARLTVAAAELGDDRMVLEHAGSHLATDPLAEEAYRALMRAHVRMGNRAEALRIYHRCTQVLFRELGVEPDPETEATYQRVRTIASSAADRGRDRASTVLVGRDDELALLRSGWQRASGGEARLVLVTGESGIGKSRLTQEFVHEVGDLATVVHARCYEAAGRLPWGPIVDWLRAPKLARRLAGLAPAWRAELSVLLPELSDEIRSTRASGQVVEPARRRQLFDAVGTALLGEPGPLLLVLDDLQWCDADSLELIGFLITSHPDVPILIAGTARDAEVGPSHPLQPLLDGLRRTDNLTELALTRLDEEATFDLARTLTDVPLSAQQLERIWQETEGNPLFVVETARAGLDGGRSGTMPATIRATISLRLERLSPAARSAVEMAAVVGRQFTFDLLVAAIDDTEDTVLGALDELWRHQIIREHGQSYDFDHDKIREAASDGLSPVQGRRLNQAVADALITVHGPEPGLHSAQVADHLERAGQAAGAVEAFHAATRHALDVYAVEEAEAACRRGLALLEQLPAGRARDESEVELRLLLAPTLVAIEGYTSVAAKEVFERCLSLCDRLGRSPDPPTLRGLGIAASVSCRFDRAAIHGEALVSMSDDPIAVIEGHYVLGVTGFWRGDMARSRHHLHAAVDSYVPEHGDAHRTYFSQDPYAVCSARLGVTLIWSGDTEQGWERLDEAHAFATSLGHPRTLAYALLYLSFAAAELGDLDRLRRGIDEGTHLWAEQRLTSLGLLGSYYEPWFQILDGDRRAIEDLRIAVAGLDHESERLHLTHALSILGRACLMVGEFDEGLEAVRRAITWGVDRGQLYSEPLLRQVEGQLLVATGDVEGASSALAAGASLARSQGSLLLEERAETTLRSLQSAT